MGFQISNHTTSFVGTMVRTTNVQWTRQVRFRKKLKMVGMEFPYVSILDQNKINNYTLCNFKFKLKY